LVMGLVIITVILIEESYKNITPKLGRGQPWSLV